MDSHVGLLRKFKLFNRQELLHSILDKLVHRWHLHLRHVHLLLHHHWIYHLCLLVLAFILLLKRFVSSVATIAVLLLLHLKHLLVLLHLTHVVWAILEILTNWLLHVLLLTKYLLLIKTGVWCHHVSKLLGKILQLILEIRLTAHLWHWR